MTQSRKIPSMLMALKMIMEGTADTTEQEFFKALVRNLAEVLDVHGVWITELQKEEGRLKALAFWLGGESVPHYAYDLAGTPCEPVICNDGLFHVQDKVIELFPNDVDLPSLGAVSYMGISLKDVDGTVLGHLAMLDDKPMKEVPEAFHIFRIFASRAAAEMRRIRAAEAVLEHKARLERLFDGITVAIFETMEDGRITQVNQAGMQLFHHEGFLPGRNLKDLISEEHVSKVWETLKNGGFGNRRCSFLNGNDQINAQVSVCSYQHAGQQFCSVFLRDLKELDDASKKIELLTLEKEQLQEAVRKSSFAHIIGSSAAIEKVLSEVEQVAPTDSSVLILGETGTGKELIAKAVHQASLRKDKPFVTLNCAVLPAELIESELFGHVKGAFTGAASTREGRFSIAHTGTIFLDEIGELPVSLQAKLLRVLQEGEFEKLGTSQTIRTDVRVIAATNRDLQKEVQKGHFREDLYYRLNVFPLYVPPLRERGNDIIEIAQALIDKFASGKAYRLTEQQKAELLRYQWPGNVRELNNVIERAMIISRNGHLILPALSMPSPPVFPENPLSNVVGVMNEQELRSLEKENIIKALKMSNGKVSGKGGAAALLQIPTTTLTSRIKKFNIRMVYEVEQ